MGVQASSTYGFATTTTAAAAVERLISNVSGDVKMHDVRVRSKV
jgi:hypothetical protein